MKVIREIKNILPNLNLVQVCGPLVKSISDRLTAFIQAKKFVEEAPKVLKEGVSKEEAQKLKELLEPLGAKVDIE